MSSLYDGIENVAAPRLPFLTDGVYALDFVVAKVGRNFKDKKEYFKVDVTVAESDGPEALAPGTAATIKIDEDTQYGYHKRDIRNLVAAILGESEHAVKASLIDELLSDDNPAAGVRFYARRGPTTDAKGRTFTKTVFASTPFLSEAPAKGKGRKSA